MDTAKRHTRLSVDERLSESSCELKSDPETRLVSKKELLHVYPRVGIYVKGNIGKRELGEAESTALSGSLLDLWTA